MNQLEEAEQLQEQDVLDLRLAEQELFRQSLEEKGARVRELEAEVRYLRDLVNGLVVAPRPQAAVAGAAPRPRTGAVPSRWKV